MNKTRTNKTLIQYLWLLLGGILLIFSNGRWVIPIASWMGPVFLVSFYRARRGFKGIFPVILVIILSMAFIAFNGVVPEEGTGQYLILLGLGLAFSIPFIVDNFFFHRIGGFRATLLLPLIGVVFEYISALINPYASWGSLAYTQFGNLSIMQLASITGIWGISFLLYWFYSFISYAWQNGFKIDKIKRGAKIFVSVYLVIGLLWGSSLIFLSPDSEQIRVASISVAQELWEVLEPLQSTGVISLKEREEINSRLAELQQKLLELTEREAKAGAKIILWHEANGVVLKENEEAFISQAAEMARNNNVYLLMALYTITPGEKMGGNKVVLINARGEKEFTYFKSKPVPGERSIKGDGLIKTADTPYGRIGSAICYDLDFPDLLRQAGKKDVDILLVPAADWKEIDPLHTRMAVFRAVENGFNMVRQAKGAHSLAVDYQGRVRSMLDYYHTDEKVMVTYLPTAGVKTLYSLGGDWFSLSCGVALLLLIFLGKKKNVRHREKIILKKDL